MVYCTNKNGWVVLSTLIWALLALSCSAEKKANSVSQVGDGNGNTVSVEQGGATAQTSAGAVNISGSGNTGASGSPTFPLGNDVCAGARAQASRIKPKVMFVVDRSGSTADAYPGSTNKWQAMYDALMDPAEGVIAKLQSVAYFGMVLFDGGDFGGVGIAVNIVSGVFCALFPDDPTLCPDAGATTADAGALGACPRLVITQPALNNHAAIDAQYQISLPGGTTPTALALEAAYKLLPDQQVLDQQVGPQFVILCTDGLPNGCMDTFGIPDQQGPIDQLTAAAKRGIKTYVVGVAAKNDLDAGGALNAQAYLEELAKYGNTGSPAFSPATKGDLVAALSKIIGGAVGCNVKLNGTVVAGQECSGTVLFNSQPLECNGANGWKLVSSSEIELQGTSCQKFKDDPAAIVNATFPCNSFVLE